MAAEKTVTVRIRAEIGRFRADMDAAAKAAETAAKKTEKAGADAQSGIGKLAQTANAHQEAWSQVSTGLVAGGVAIVGGLTLATKAAMDWESAWTGVLKTVNGTPAQLSQVENGLLGLAKTLPETHTEIAGVAEAAGQLGVATKDVVGFTKTMVDLGVSTNLTAEDAATQIAQISNVMGTMKREGTEGVSRFGAALVALGNDGASTEAEILSMAQRIAGAGATIGASESDVLALSNTLSSMGVNAELGGGVTTRVLLKMYSAVQEGGDKLDSFAQTAGMSADQFAEAFRTSPVEALDAVNKGLSRVKNEGGNVVATMKSLGIKGTEETQVMLALAASGDLLSDSLQLGNKAWAENTALVDEANKRYETSSSKVKIAWNNMKDSAIDAGSVILPAVASIADGAAKIASVFGDLPEPMQKILVTGAAVVGVTALVAGGFMKLVPGIVSTAASLRGLAGATLGATTGLFGTAAASNAAGLSMNSASKSAAALNRALGVIGLLAMVGPTVAAMVPSGALADTDAMGAALLRMGSGGEAAKTGLAEINKMFTSKGNFFDGVDVKGLEDAFKVIGNRDVADNVDLILSKTLSLGTRGSSNIEFAKKNFEQLDAQLAQMAANGNADSAAKSYEMIASAAKNAGVDQAVLNEHFPAYAKALSETSAEAQQAAESAQMLGTAMGVAFPVTKDMAEGLAEIGVSADGSITSIDKLLSTLWQLSDGTLDVRAANRAVEDTFRSMEETIKKNGKSLDEHTAKGSENQAALDSYIGTLKQRTNAIATAVDENGDLVHSDQEVQDSMSKSYKQAVDAAGKFGVFGKEADTLARSLLGIPKDVNIKTWLEDFATDRANGITGVLDAMPERKDIKVLVSEDGTTKLTQAQIDAIMGQTVGVEVTDEGTVLSVQGKINGVTDGDARLLVSDDGSVRIVQGKINGVNDGSANVNVTSSGVSIVESAINNVARNRTSTVSVSYNVPPVPLAPSLASKLVPRNMFGGQIPRNAAGSKLPTTGPGTDTRDGILGVTKDGVPLSWLDGGEWVINRDSSRKHDRLARMINDDDPRLEGLSELIGLKSGGRVGWSQGEDAKAKRAADAATRERKQAEKDAKASEKAYNAIDGKKENKSAKAAAKRRRDKDNRELAAAKKAEDKAKEALRDSKERTARLSEGTFDLRRETKRGDIVEAFTSGNGMGMVDRMFEASNNKDLSKKQRASMRALAYQTEDALLKLEKRAESTGKKLESAREKRDDLLSIRDGVASGLRGETSLGGLIGEHQATRYGRVTAGGIANLGRSKVAKMKAFGDKLDALRKKGYGGAVVQEIAEMGTEAGMEAATILLAGSKSDVSALNSVYKDLETQANRAGNYVTDALSKGGLNAAESLVDTLAKKEGDIEKAFYDLGIAGQKGFHRAWGIASPAKEAKKDAKHIVDGSVLGIKAEAPRFAAAMEGLYAAPSMPDAARYAVPAYVPAQVTAAQVAQNLTVIVENPWTGKQMEAKVRMVANEEVSKGQMQFAGHIANQR
ncbi:phage tail tape measure protein [Paeniglutamicibacter sp. NPDC012692]|uniref:phage tail tape measure protein n=1 Tax=Paeniglutamicibacter sp. NPDC012692 TaxID=3364388 RepID=UPI0036CBB1CC